MGKRSDFPRRKHDSYDTPDRAVLPLVPFLHDSGVTTFVEPCCGKGKLVMALEARGFRCPLWDDIQMGRDALDWKLADMMGQTTIITNPPWTFRLLEPLLWHWLTLADEVWLLLGADFMHNVESAALMARCSDIVPVGRVRWIEGTTRDPKDNACWYRFSPCKKPTIFHPRQRFT